MTEARNHTENWLTRRAVVTRLAASVLLTHVIPAWSATGAAISEIAPGVFVHRGEHAHYTPDNRGDISNCGFIVGSDAVAVIDSGGTANFGQRFREAISAITDKPIRYVINTHMHPDHVLGNAAFRADGVRFVGHHKLGPALAARAERYLAANRLAAGDEAFAGTEIVLPDLAVSERTTLDLGGRSIVLEPRPTAHTDNDLTVSDTATGTMFLGDLVFSGHVPALDGSIRGWLALLGELAREPIARVVPGHGPAAMAWPDAALPVQRYLGAIASEVRAAIRSGKSLSETMKTAAASEREHWQLFDDFHQRNVAAAFAELEWE